MAGSASSQIRSLAKAVATAFAAAPLKDEERYPKGAIEHTDLPWACPPLITPLELDGALQDYFDTPLLVDEQQLHRFWVVALQDMYHAPSRLMKDGNYAGLAKVMPSAKVGQRALRFSVPLGWPGEVDITAGVTLSLEVAHCAATSLPLQHVHSTDDDYVVTTSSGTRFGVEGGRPLVPCQFDFNARGLVTDLLLSSRGEIDYRCHHDQLAAVRSVLHSNASKFKRNFDALDQALQALRFLSIGSYCPELVTQMIIKPQEMQLKREKERAIYDAIDVMRSKMSDRAKLNTMRALLVPAVMTVAKFKSEVFSSPTFPFSMAPGKSEQIESNLVDFYSKEIPAALQRPL